MSILVFIDQADGHIKKASFEAATYGAKLAAQLGTTAEALVLGTVSDDLSTLGQYGIKKVHTVSDASLNKMDAAVYADVIAQAAGQATVIVLSNNTTGKAVAPRLSVKLKAGLVSGAISLPDTSQGFVVRKSVFSGKAFANIAVKTDKKIIALNPNAFGTETGAGSAEVAAVQASIPASNVEVVAVNKVSGEVPLSEAAICVRGGWCLI